MTARWSGVFPERSGNVAKTERISKANAGGFPQVLGGQSPKRVFLLRVLVTRTSVVEMSSKHLGDAPKECRKAREVSGAVRQQAPLTRAVAKQQRRRPTWTGPEVILQAKRCSDGIRSASAKASPTSDLGAQRSQDPSSPSVVMSANR